MSIFWQHVGFANSNRDLPKTIGNSKSGLIYFTTNDLCPDIKFTETIISNEVISCLSNFSNMKFQVWGLPVGAEKTLSVASPGDYLMLLDTNSTKGIFRYIGKILAVLPGRHPELSFKLWSESKFPLIVFTDGDLIAYPWQRFLQDFGYGSGLLPMGRTWRISDEAFQRGPAPDDDTFFRYVTDDYKIECSHII